MLPFPFSLCLIPLAAASGVFYVTLGRGQSTRARGRGIRFVRFAVLCLTWVSPLTTRGPGAAQLTVGLLVGFLGIRMVALSQRWGHHRQRALPEPRRILLAMVTPEELLVPATRPLSRPSRALLGGLVAAALCAGMLVAGNRVRLWHQSKAADDLLVFIEVAVGATGVHHLVVGIAGLLGHSVAGLLDHPFLSASFTQFWGRRWNRVVQGNLDRAFFRPNSRSGHWVRGTVVAFAASGIMHVLAVLAADPLGLTLAPSLSVMTFFLLQAGLVLTERHFGWHRQPHGRRALLWARVRTIGLFILLSPLLLDPFARVAHVHGRVLGGP